jgi:hypothetical protein
MLSSSGSASLQAQEPNGAKPGPSLFLLWAAEFYQAPNMVMTTRGCFGLPKRDAAHGQSIHL